MRRPGAIGPPASGSLVLVARARRGGAPRRPGEPGLRASGREGRRFLPWIAGPVFPEVRHDRQTPPVHRRRPHRGVPGHHGRHVARARRRLHRGRGLHGHGGAGDRDPGRAGLGLPRRRDDQAGLVEAGAPRGPEGAALGVACAGAHGPARCRLGPGWSRGR
ncbi:hypothetical protein NOCARDAX2BIS_600037 [Nocardioides sp. AX2bis]|nr:hypothetical protein NOCARDAX2BIS_600037 [Nocardioides sp. AX2bis]